MYVCMDGFTWDSYVQITNNHSQNISKVCRAVHSLYQTLYDGFILVK